MTIRLEVETHINNQIGLPHKMVISCLYNNVRNAKLSELRKYWVDFVDFSFELFAARPAIWNCIIFTNENDR